MYKFREVPYYEGTNVPGNTPADQFLSSRILNKKSKSSRREVPKTPEGEKHSSLCFRPTGGGGLACLGRNVL